MMGMSEMDLHQNSTNDFVFRLLVHYNTAEYGIAEHLFYNGPKGHPNKDMAWQRCDVTQISYKSFYNNIRRYNSDLHSNNMIKHDLLFLSSCAWFFI